MRGFLWKVQGLYQNLEEENSLYKSDVRYNKENKEIEFPLSESPLRMRQNYSKKNPSLGISESQREDQLSRQERKLGYLNFLPRRRRKSIDIISHLQH